MPPEEYVEAPVNNSEYMAAIVQKTFDFVLRIQDSQKYEDIEIPKKWKDIRDRLYIPYDFNNKRHLEFEGFEILIFNFFFFIF